MPQYSEPENPFARPATRPTGGSTPAGLADTGPIVVPGGTLTLTAGPPAGASPWTGDASSAGAAPGAGRAARRDRRGPLAAVLLGRSTRGLVVRGAAAGAVLVLVVATAIAYAAFDRTVTLDVDGQTQQVSFFGTEVTDALAAADLQVGERDFVSPALGESVADGGTVTVRFGREFTVAVDGEAQAYWTTALTVDEAIAALGLRFEGAALSASRSTPIGRQGLAIEVTTPKDVTVVTSAGEQAFTSTSRTVGDVLAEAGIGADGDDRVDPAVDTPVTDGLRISYTKVEVVPVEEAVPVEAPTRTVETDDLFVGETEVVQEGSDGVETVTFSVTLIDGVEESRQETGRTVTTQPVERVVEEGTKPRPAPQPAPAGAAGPSGNVGGDADSLNWAALAACESGGNPSIVSSNGLYHGLYQFDRGTWQSVGGSGVASQAPASEQTYRAKLLYQSRGAAPWPSCGPRLFS